MIVLDKDGSVRSVTDQARFWLEQFPRDRGTGLQLPVAVHAVAERAMAIPSHPVLPPYATVRLTSGEWLTVHAAPLRTDSPNTTSVAGTLAPASPTELEPPRLALHGLTPREREVAQLLARGASNEEIAKALWISRYTVKDHVKAVYAKLRVGGRAELTAKLFHEHIAHSSAASRSASSASRTRPLAPKPATGPRVDPPAPEPADLRAQLVLRARPAV